MIQEQERVTQEQESEGQCAWCGAVTHHECIFCCSYVCDDCISADEQCCRDCYEKRELEFDE